VRRSARGLAPLALLAASACVAFSNSSQPTQFYLLSSSASRDPEAASGLDPEGLAIGVGPIEIPPHLNRSQIVTRTEGNRLKLAEFHRWGEPLRANVARVIAEDLAVLLATDRVSVYPWPRSVPIEYRVRVDIRRFAADPEGTVRLRCRWTLADAAGKALRIRMARFDAPATAGDYDSIVAAMSSSLTQLSGELGAAIREVHGGG